MVRLPKSEKVCHYFSWFSAFKRTSSVFSSFLFFFLIALNCPAYTYKTVYGVRVIENQVITEHVIIDGSAWNGGIIRNNIFRDQTGLGLTIKNVQNLTIENNEFTGMQLQGILLAENQTGTDNVTIRNNYFHDMPYHGIHAQEPNTNLKILNNTFINVTVAASGDKRHAIYLKGPGFLVEGNKITGVADGHGISVRTAGTVRGNWVEGAYEFGISYYSDASTSGNGVLIVESNVCVNNGLGGIKFDNSGGSIKISKGITRFNTLVDNNTGVSIDSGWGSTQFEVYGNLVVESALSYAEFGTQPVVLKDNFTSSSDIGFVSFLARDFHLMSNSTALGYVKSAPEAPSYDYEGHSMGSAPYDAGAFQSISVQTELPPAPITNLAAPSTTSTSVTLTWTATGDDGSTGTAASYDLRYSTSSITSTNFNNAKQILNEPFPKASGSAETFKVTGLKRYTRYYFAIKTIDHEGNISSLSNVPSKRTNR